MVVVVVVVMEKGKLEGLCWSERGRDGAGEEEASARVSDDYSVTRYAYKAAPRRPLLVRQKWSKHSTRGLHGSTQPVVFHLSLRIPSLISCTLPAIINCCSYI